MKRGTIPRKIKGFRDIDADLNELRQQIINAASKVYKSYGFEHWETPVLEYADALGKYMPDEDTVDQGCIISAIQRKNPFWERTAMN